MQADWKEELLNEDQGIELILDENPEETDYQITSPKMSPWIKLGLIGGGIVATGGAGALFYDELGVQNYEPDLTLHGLRMIAEAQVKG